MQKDTTILDNVKHINAMIYLISSVEESSKLNYCKLLAIPQLKKMGIEVKDATIKGVLSAMYAYKTKHRPSIKPNFRNKKGDDIEEMDISIPINKWEKHKNKYEFFKNDTIVGIVEILDKSHEERYKWVTEKGSGTEKYLYKAQKHIELYAQNL